LPTTVLLLRAEDSCRRVLTTVAMATLLLVAMEPLQTGDTAADDFD